MPHTKLGPFTVEFANSEEFHRLKTEIFTHDCYYVDLPTSQPYIIDAGAHLGLTTLYFKKQFPAAQILAIEPHPDTFALLEKNVFNNNLENVELLNTAISTSDELITLYEDRTEERWYSTASLFPQAWNGQQQTQPLTVPSLRLQTLLADIEGTVDLLKLDIEGAELDVLRDSQTALTKVNALILEFHPRADQTLAQLLKLLTDQGFRHTEGDPKAPKLSIQLFQR